MRCQLVIKIISKDVQKIANWLISGETLKSIIKYGYYVWIKLPAFHIFLRIKIWTCLYIILEIHDFDIPYHAYCNMNITSICHTVTEILYMEGLVLVFLSASRWKHLYVTRTYSEWYSEKKLIILRPELIYICSLHRQTRPKLYGIN